jgi:hypothetical protein
MPEINPIKKGRGGKRPGAGRKPNMFKHLYLPGGTVTRNQRPRQRPSYTAAEVLARCCNEIEAWKWFLTHKDPDIRLKAFVYLTDRRDGKPRQAVDVSGGIVHAHTVYRDPRLAALSPEELQLLDALTKKLALPAPDSPQNQIESKPDLR